MDTLQHQGSETAGGVSWLFKHLHYCPLPFSYFFCLKIIPFDFIFFPLLYTFFCVIFWWKMNCLTRRWRYGHLWNWRSAVRGNKFGRSAASEHVIIPHRSLHGSLLVADTKLRRRNNRIRVWWCVNNTASLEISNQEPHRSGFYWYRKNETKASPKVDERGVGSRASFATRYKTFVSKIYSPRWKRSRSRNSSICMLFLENHGTNYTVGGELKRTSDKQNKKQQRKCGPSTEKSDELHCFFSPNFIFLSL